MTEPYQKIIDAAQKMDHDFWDSWYESTVDYPDIADANTTKMLALKVGIATIFGKYLIGFKKEVRTNILEDFIQTLRLLEASMRDEE